MKLSAYALVEFLVCGKEDEDFIRETREIVQELNDKYSNRSKIVMIYRTSKNFEDSLIYPNVNY